MNHLTMEGGSGTGIKYSFLHKSQQTSLEFPTSSSPLANSFIPTASHFVKRSFRD